MSIVSIVTTVGTIIARIILVTRSDETTEKIVDINLRSFLYKSFVLTIHCKFCYKNKGRILLNHYCYVILLLRSVDNKQFPVDRFMNTIIFGFIILQAINQYYGV